MCQSNINPWFLEDDRQPCLFPMYIFFVQRSVSLRCVDRTDVADLARTKGQERKKHQYPTRFCLRMSFGQIIHLIVAKRRFSGLC